MFLMLWQPALFCSRQLWVREPGLIPACLSEQAPAGALDSQSATVSRGVAMSLSLLWEGRSCEVLKLAAAPGLGLFVLFLQPREPLDSSGNQ